MKIKVLLLEDDREDVDYITGKLEREAPGRYLIHSIEDTRGANVFMSFQQYDILLVDYQLRDADFLGTGTNFIQQLRQSGSHVPCIMITAMPQVAIDKTLTEMINQGQLFFLDKADLPGIHLDVLIHEAIGSDFQILHLEDDEDDADLIRDYITVQLPHRFSLTHVKTIDEAREAMSMVHFEAYLVDLNLGVDKGRDFILELLGMQDDPVIVIISGSDTMYLDTGMIHHLGRKRVSLIAKNDLDPSGLSSLIAHQRSHITRGNN